MNTVLDLFAELRYVLENRKQRPSTFQIRQACVPLVRLKEYDNVLKRLDSIMFRGKLWEALNWTGYRVEIRTGKRKNVYTAAASTTYFEKTHTFTITLRLPGNNETKPKTSHVGGKVCKADSCVVELLIHEFVHVLELFLRKELCYFAGFSKEDKNNILFTQWLRILFDHHHDRNVI
jgi:hypothetical protein